MEESTPPTSDRLPSSADRRRQLAGRLRRLVLKELREILRDRRTIITLVVMPILIYPLLAVVFQRFLVTSISVDKNVEYVIGVDSEASAATLLRQIDEGNTELERQHEEQDARAVSKPQPSKERGWGDENAEPEEEKPPKLNFHLVLSEDAARQVIDSSVHLVAVQQRRIADDDSAGGLETPTAWELVYRAGSPPSEAALHFVEARLQAYNELTLNKELDELE